MKLIVSFNEDKAVITRCTKHLQSITISYMISVKRVYYKEHNSLGKNCDVLAMAAHLILPGIGDAAEVNYNQVGEQRYDDSG